MKIVIRQPALFQIGALFLVLICIGCSGPDEATTDSTGSIGASKRFVQLTGFDRVVDHLYRQKLTPVEDDQDVTTSLFELVADSGVDFSNEFDRGKPLRWIETGAGVAIADYDNDGLADIYLLATDGPNKLFRGTGNFQFEDVTAAAGVDGSIDGKDVWGAGASFADVDNDGDLDLFVCNMTARNILYVNEGNGKFSDRTFQSGLGYKGASKIGSFCDYDLDGDLDMYLLTYQDLPETRACQLIKENGRVFIHPDFRDSYGFVGEQIKEAGEKDILYRNDGKGKFTNVTADAQIVAHEMGLSVCWYDYDADGLPDIYVANDFFQPDRLFRNKGDGTFVDVLPEVAKHIPWFSMGSDTGDLNNDGLIDLIVGEMSSSTHFKQKINMGGMAESGWFLEYGAPRQYMRNAMFVNSGVGKFMEVAFMAGVESTGWTWAMRLVDLNNDGLLDLFATNGHARDSMNSDSVDELVRLKEAGKFDELLEANKKIPPIREKNRAFVNKGDLEFEDTSEQWGLDHEGISHGVAFADFDSDGDLDMVVNNLYEPASVYRNLSQAGNRIAVEFRSPRGNSYGYGAKVQLFADGLQQTKVLTPVRGYLSSDEPKLHFGLGVASKVDRMVVTWPNGISQEFQDLEANYCYRIIDSKTAQTASEKNAFDDHDSTTDFAEADKGIGIDFVHHDGEYDDFSREPLLPFRLSQLGPGVAANDINEDGFADIFLCSGNDRPGALFVSRGGIRFEEVDGPWTEDFFCEDMAALFFDADSDGDDDLLVTTGGNEVKLADQLIEDRLYINLGNEQFVAAEKDVLPKRGFSSSTAAAADFDRDGDLDLVIGTRTIPRQYPLSSPTRLLRNDEGKFTDVSSDVAKELDEIGIVNSVLWSDFDGDGWVDLILATGWGPVKFLKNQNGEFSDVTNQLGLSEYRGWWKGLAAGDFDSDGDLDYIATNQGLNTKYHANKLHPHRLYYGDFDGNGKIDLVEAEFEGETEFPVRGLSCSSNAMPFIGEKFKKFKDFAIAPLEDIYCVKQDDRKFKEVNYLESAVIWNEGHQMRVEALPRLAQTSPGFGVESLDYDCDGDLDVIIGNNFFGSQPETGFMDGGLGVLLNNNGTGKFSFVWPSRSGLSLDDDSMGLAVTDLDQDGDPDVVVGCNQSAARVLINQANPEKHLVIRLKGSQQNSNAIGSHLLFNYRDGTNRRLELRAGGSYLSQSANVVSVCPSILDRLESILVTWPTGEQTRISRRELIDAKEELVVRFPHENRQ